MAKIYLSSTYKDLVEFRFAIYHALRELRQDVIAMEDYVATDERPLEKCLYDVSNCDVYIGIFAWRYGYIPASGNPTEKSITELEYRNASELKKQCLIFLLDEKTPWHRDLMDEVTGEGDSGRRIKDFRSELQKIKVVSFFRTPEELARQVSIAIRNWENGRDYNERGELDLKSTFHQYREAFENDVHRQIDKFARRKFIKDLYIQREFQKELAAFHRPEPELARSLRKAITGALLVDVSHFSGYSENIPGCISQLNALLKAGRQFKAEKFETEYKISRDLLGEVVSDLTASVKLVSKISPSLAKASTEAHRLSDKLLLNQSSVHEDVLDHYDKLKTLIAKSPLYEARTLGGPTLVGKLIEHIGALKAKQSAFKKSFPASIQQLIKILEKYPLPHADSILYRINSAIHTLQIANRPATVIIDRAGGGKTSLLCGLSLEMAQKAPTMLLFGKENYQNAEAMIKRVTDCIRNLIPIGDKADPMGYLDQVLLANQEFLHIFIDGINECRRITEFNETIILFLEWASLHRIRVTISCRDIYWGFFDSDRWEQYANKISENKLYQFTTKEYEKALPAYLKHYRIRCDLVGDALAACQHPLLLRFFCEAYSSREDKWVHIGTIKDIRLKELFDVYLENKTDQIRHFLNHKNTDTVVRFLLDMADHLYKYQATFLMTYDIHTATGHEDTSTQDSLYLRLLDEDIIIEEQPADNIDYRRVHFVYEEFMEYIIAKSFLHKKRRNLYSAIGDIFNELNSALDNWVNARGVVEYLIIMLLGSNNLEEREQGFELLTMLVKTEGIWIEAFWSSLGKLPLSALQPRLFDFLYPAIQVTPTRKQKYIKEALLTMSKYSEVGVDKLASIFLWSAILPNVLKWSDIVMLDEMSTTELLALAEKLSQEHINNRKFSSLAIVKGSTNILGWVIPYLDSQAREKIKKKARTYGSTLGNNISHIMHYVRAIHPEYQPYLLNGLFHEDIEIATVCADNLRFVTQNRGAIVFICRHLAGVESRPKIKRYLNDTADWLEQYRPPRYVRTKD
jgi:hypothetical protein